MRKICLSITFLIGCSLLIACDDVSNKEEEPFSSVKETTENTEEESNLEESSLLESVTSQTETLKETEKKYMIETESIIYNESLLPFMELKEGYSIEDYAEVPGKLYTYHIFRMRNIENFRLLYWEILLEEGEEIVQTLRVENEERGGPYFSSEDMIIETDVNFDGKDDILIGLGHFGAQGLITHKCYLVTDNGLQHCPSFSEISNPEINPDRHIILSSWRNNAASHSWSLYSFIDNEFVETERVTLVGKRDEDSNRFVNYTYEVLVNGEWEIKESADYGEEDTGLTEKFYEDSHWGISSDRWIRLNNETRHDNK